MLPTTRLCDHCGLEYSRSKRKELGRFCSVACYGAAKRREITSTCLQCGVDFRHAARSKRKFCSHACAGNSLRKLVTRECDVCGKPYTRAPSHVGKYCSTDCRRAGHRKETTAGRRMVNVPQHPLTSTSSIIPEYRKLLYEAIGSGTHPCHHCGIPVTWSPGAGCTSDALVVDHLDRNPRNDSPENLVPSCQRCNVLNSSRTVRDHESFRVVKHGTRLRGEARSCEQCGSPFVAYPDKRPGRGRFCSRSCARKGPRSPQPS